MNHLLIFFRGLAMGAADVVPGVSGGTIAFITNIYERLLNGIKSVNFQALKILRKEGLTAAWKHIDGTFLLTLFVGIAISILSLSKVLKWCLYNYPQLLWAFFFGLIVASAIYILKQVEKWNAAAVVAIIAGTIVAYLITIISPTEASTDFGMVFFAGAIAICAMILPGISGSFILLLMGMYKHVLDAISDRDITFLLIFMSGCVLGLLTFSHLLSWTFKHYRNTTLAVLSGFMIGSLNKVWPWQNVVSYRTNSHGEEVPWQMTNTLPSGYEGDPYILWCILLALVGFGVVFLLERLGEQKAI